eukprot:86846-Chlamydomonas_euryale.AAC.1
MQKLGLQEETVEAGKLDSNAKRLSLEAELGRAADFFRLLGWHSGPDARLLDALLGCVVEGGGARSELRRVPGL